MSGICGACLQPIPDGNEIIHHTSYDPEKVILVHRRCHWRIHNTEEFPTLKPHDNSGFRTVKVADDTHSRLEKAGLKGETFDDIVRRLLDMYEQAKFVKAIQE